jgi:RNA polymerase sigma-70 factor (ECF subfamily)
MFYLRIFPSALPTWQERRRGSGHASTTAPDTSESSQRADSASMCPDNLTLSQLYEQFRRPIYSYAYRLLDNQEDAADVTQEVFLRACIAWESLRDHDHLGVWLHHVATNLCVDLLRRRKRLSWRSFAWRNRHAQPTEEVQGEASFRFLPPDAGGIPAIAEREHIQLALAQMPQEYAVVLVLSVAQGLSYLEIATIVGLSPAAAATRISRAKKMFVTQYQHLSRDGIGEQEKRS